MDYTLIFVAHKDNIVLINKKRPNWQKGLYNLPGGKIEPGESVLSCAFRELKEETGLDVNSGKGCLRHVSEPDVARITTSGKLVGSDWTVHVISVFLKNDIPSDEILLRGEENPRWVSIFDAANHLPLMPNLHVMLPLLAFGRKFEMEDLDEISGTGSTVSVGVKVDHKNIEYAREIREKNRSPIEVSEVSVGDEVVSEGGVVANG